MDSTHLHLILNHFPIIGTLIALGILTYAVFFKKQELSKAALVIIVLMAIIAIPVFKTGEAAEETVENIPGVLESAIEAHEEAAELAMIFMEIGGGMALLALIALLFPASMGKWKNSFLYLALAIGWVAFFLMARTGNTGGEIRHTELNGSVAQTSTVPETGSETEEDD